MIGRSLTGNLFSKSVKSAEKFKTEEKNPKLNQDLKLGMGLAKQPNTCQVKLNMLVYEASTTLCLLL